MSTLGDRLKHSWNAFIGRDPTNEYIKPLDYGVSTSLRPDRTHLSFGNEKSIVSSIYNRIAIDVASVDIRHVRLDENKNYVEEINSGLNDILSVEANLDQTSRNFIMDAVISMFDEGYVALVPVETSTKPTNPAAYDILQLRTGKIVEWYPQHVKVNVYNEFKGTKEDLILPRSL